MDKVLRSEDVELLLVTVKGVAVFYKRIGVAIELNVYSLFQLQGPYNFLPQAGFEPLPIAMQVMKQAIYLQATTAR